MTQSSEECAKERPTPLRQNGVYVFVMKSFLLYKTAFEAKMTVAPSVERSLTADEDALLCNWDFKSTCSARVTFQCLSPTAWQELMTANNAIFKASHLRLSKCEYFST